MYELIRASGETYFIECPAKIGLYRRTDDEVYLIDSGSDKDAGRKVRKLLDEKGWKLRAIYLTHSNADHIGGCRYLQQQTGCRIFAPQIEGDFTNHPILEPSFLYGGYPCKELRGKFLLAQPADAQNLTDADLPAGFESIPLPGHFFNMTGFRTPDDVVFLADCLASRETLEKHPLWFLYDIAAALQTLEKVSALSAALFIPSHAAPAEKIADLAQFNREKICEIADRIVSHCAGGSTFETILQNLFDDYAQTMTIEQYALIGSTVRSYLSFLKDSGRLTFRMENNRLLWEKV